MPRRSVNKRAERAHSQKPGNIKAALCVGRRTCDHRFIEIAQWYYTSIWSYQSRYRHTFRRINCARISPTKNPIIEDMDLVIIGFIAKERL